MEMRGNVKYRLLTMVFVFFLLAMTQAIYAQPPLKKYTISKGEMQIVLSKNLPEEELNAFIEQYELKGLAIPAFLHKNFKDSLFVSGWKILVNNNELIVLSKPMLSADDMNNPAARINLIDMVNKAFEGAKNIPVSRQTFGFNQFKNRGNIEVKDSIVTLLFRETKRISKVLLAGSFTNWQDGAIPMQLTDSGWITQVKLSPGKYTYKFIVDGDWMTDPHNKNLENDGEGNTNSVLFVTNHLFKLPGFMNAKKVYLSGSFNEWHEQQARMVKTKEGWELPVYLTEGTYVYRFIVDEVWMTDPANNDVFPNEFNEYNSVVRIGTPYLFQLKGYVLAANVFLAGSFNAWRRFELKMSKTGEGWELPYTIGAGNYEFKYYVDGVGMDANGKEVKENEPGTIFIIEPNYTFRLKNMPDAKTIYVAGDFNYWSPNGYALKKEGEEWVLPLHLSKGKHLYKFIVDGNWIIDPQNPLWEQNEFNNGNSVIWIE